VLVEVNLANLTIKLITTRQEFTNDVISSLRHDILLRLKNPSLQSRIKEAIQDVLSQSLKQQPEYIDMVAHDGVLRAELGVVDSESSMNSLVEDWVSSVSVSIRPPILIGNKLKGKIISIRAIQADYEDVLDKLYASYTTEKGVQINWLQWLLTAGVKIMVKEHLAIKPRNGTNKSRTETNTIMVKTHGKGWGVPPEYSGTLRNNFATRAVIEAIPKIEQVFIAEFSRNF
jgi:hypothetical protein